MFCLKIGLDKSLQSGEIWFYNMASVSSWKWIINEFENCGELRCLHDVCVTKEIWEDMSRAVNWYM